MTRESLCFVGFLEQNVSLWGAFVLFLAALSSNMAGQQLGEDRCGGVCCHGVIVDALFVSASACLELSSPAYKIIPNLYSWIKHRLSRQKRQRSSRFREEELTGLERGKTSSAGSFTLAEIKVWLPWKLSSQQALALRPIEPVFRWTLVEAKDVRVRSSDTRPFITKAKAVNLLVSLQKVENQSDALSSTTVSAFSCRWANSAFQRSIFTEAESMDYIMDQHVQLRRRQRGFCRTWCCYTICVVPLMVTGSFPLGLWVCFHPSPSFLAGQRSSVIKDWPHSAYWAGQIHIGSSEGGWSLESGDRVLLTCDVS